MTSDNGQADQGARKCRIHWTTLSGFDALDLATRGDVIFAEVVEEHNLLAKGMNYAQVRTVNKQTHHTTHTHTHTHTHTYYNPHSHTLTHPHKFYQRSSEQEDPRIQDRDEQNHTRDDEKQLHEIEESDWQKFVHHAHVT